MIKEICFTKEHIQSFRNIYKKANSEYVEKTIYAFELLSLLVKSGMEFIFKGGTSLLLLLPEPKRLSIDIDIVGKIDITKFDSMIENTKFTGVEPDLRQNDKENIKHFIFYYDSVFKAQNPHILLDIVLKEHNFPNSQNKLIKTPFFETSEIIKTEVPFINSILADKLTAFAPKTIGIPFDEKSTARKTGIIKQLFDISNLFDFANNLNVIKNSYTKLQTFECDLRKKTYSIKETLKDSIETSYLICQSGLKGSISNNEIEILRFGCKNLKNYLLDGTFSLEQAKIPASKIAFLASALLYESKVKLNDFKYNPAKIGIIKDLKLDGKYRLLTRLKSIEPEAFYYWHLVSQIEEGKL